MLPLLLRRYDTPIYRHAVFPSGFLSALFALLLLFAPFFPGPQGEAASPASDMPPESDMFDLPGSGISSSGQLPFLTILYNAMTTGDLHPCPT